MLSSENQGSELTPEEVNQRRIAVVEKWFRFPPNKLKAPNRILLGEGVLMKVCRRKPKLRHVFLFSDTVLYGSIFASRKMLRKPKFIELRDAVVEDVSDNGLFKDGFSLYSPKKSFTVYCSSKEEKLQWMNHIQKCISNLRSEAGYSSNQMVKQSPLWIPDTETSRCMVCSTAEFGLVRRKHHCRNCGKLVCNKCSSYRSVLPHQSSSKVRVCRACYLALQQNSNLPAERSPGALESSGSPGAPGGSPGSYDIAKLTVTGTAKRNIFDLERLDSVHSLIYEATDQDVMAGRSSQADSYSEENHYDDDVEDDGEEEIRWRKT